MTKIYRPNVGLCILNTDGMIFAGRRSGCAAYKGWQMPQGGVDSLLNDEVLTDGMFRELREETGIKKEMVNILQKTKNIKYDFPLEIYQSNVERGIYFSGQEQIWFLLKFHGSSYDIDINLEEKPEFDTWKWSSGKFLIENVIEMKVPVYLEVFKAFNLDI